jgi:hypothetical protein
MLKSGITGSLGLNINNLLTASTSADLRMYAGELKLNLELDGRS